MNAGRPRQREQGLGGTGSGDQRVREEPQPDSRALGVSIYGSFPPPKESLRSSAPLAGFPRGSNFFVRLFPACHRSEQHSYLRLRMSRGAQLRLLPKDQTGNMYDISRDKRGIVFTCSQCTYFVVASADRAGIANPRTVAAGILREHTAEKHPIARAPMATDAQFRMWARQPHSRR
jgi:hypothetical protein